MFRTIAVNCSRPLGCDGRYMASCKRCSHSSRCSLRLRKTAWQSWSKRASIEMINTSVFKLAMVSIEDLGAKRLAVVNDSDKRNLWKCSGKRDSFMTSYRKSFESACILEPACQWIICQRCVTGISVKTSWCGVKTTVGWPIFVDELLIRNAFK